MNLRDWMHKEMISKTQFAKLINFCPHYVCRVALFRVKPSVRFAMIVEMATKGEVTKDEIMKAEYQSTK